jgi:hypothetical protein
MLESFKILFGRSKPHIAFTIATDPPSMYFNFKIREEKLEQFEKMLNLPPGFKLTKIRTLLDDTEEYYWLTTNVYRVSGLTNGLRAECSVYVEDPEGRKRYMIVKAHTDKKSMDPINIVTKPSHLEYTFQENRLSIFLSADEKCYFKVEGALPEVKSMVFAAREWIQANDEIYWLNGVYDKPYYNGQMACAKLIHIPPDQLKLENTTEWSEYIEPEPQIVMFPSGHEYLVSPWWNI